MSDPVREGDVRDLREVSPPLPARNIPVRAAGETVRPEWQTGQPGGEARYVVEDVPGPVLSDETRRLAARIVAKYPNPRSALVPLLYLVQSEVGWVPRQGMREVGELLGITTAEVEAVATFYTMLKLHPCGRYVISVCTNPSCTLLGARETYARAKELLGEEAERMTPDGLFTLEEEECLAACDKAPVVAVNYLFYDCVDEDRVARMIEEIRGGTVPEASRGGVPGDLREVSRTIAGTGSLRPAETEPPPEERPTEHGEAHGPMGEGPAGTSHGGRVEEARGA